MKINGAAIAGVAAIGAVAWFVVTSFRENKRIKEELDISKKEKKYSSVDSDKAIKKLIFENKSEKTQNYGSDIKSEAYSILMDLNSRCKDATTKDEFLIAYEDMEQLKATYSSGSEIDLMALIKALTKYYSEPIKKTTEKKSMPSVCSSSALSDILSTVTTIAALNSGITNDYYKLRLASRW